RPAHDYRQLAPAPVRSTRSGSVFELGKETAQIATQAAAIAIRDRDPRAQPSVTCRYSDLLRARRPPWFDLAVIRNAERTAQCLIDVFVAGELAMVLERGADANTSAHLEPEARRHEQPPRVDPAFDLGVAPEHVVAEVEVREATQAAGHQ